MRRWLRALALLAAVAVVVAFALQQWYVRYRPDRARYPIRGIDVSHHQGQIDWRRVAGDDVVFAYLKASEGGDYTDSAFARNWREARAAGLDVGAYHFFTFCRSGAEQARHFLATVPVEDDALPPAVDLEFGGNCGRTPDGPELKRELEAFLSKIEAAYGKPAMLYVTPEFAQAYRAFLPQRDLWRRSIVHVPDASAPWRVWQYHNRGRIDGIRGPVDLNVFAADAARYRRWVGAARPSVRRKNP